MKCLEVCKMTKCSKVLNLNVICNLYNDHINYLEEYDLLVRKHRSITENVL